MEQLTDWKFIENFEVKEKILVFEGKIFEFKKILTLQ